MRVGILTDYRRIDPGFAAVQLADDLELLGAAVELATSRPDRVTVDPRWDQKCRRLQTYRDMAFWLRRLDALILTEYPDRPWAEWIRKVGGPPMVGVYAPGHFPWNDLPELDLSVLRGVIAPTRTAAMIFRRRLPLMRARVRAIPWGPRAWPVVADGRPFDLAWYIAGSDRYFSGMGPVAVLLELVDRAPGLRSVVVCDGVRGRLRLALRKLARNSSGRIELRAPKFWGEQLAAIGQARFLVCCRAEADFALSELNAMSLGVLPIVVQDTPAEWNIRESDGHVAVPSKTWDLNRDDRVFEVSAKDFADAIIQAAGWPLDDWRQASAKATWYARARRERFLAKWAMVFGLEAGAASPAC